MVVCGRWHLQLALLHYAAFALARQTPAGTGWGVSSYRNTPHLKVLPRKFCRLRNVHPPAQLAPSFDSTMLHNFL